MAPRLRRVGAWAVDFAVTLTVGVGIAGVLSHHVLAVVVGLPDVAVGAVSGFVAGDGGRTLTQAGSSAWENATSAVVLAFAALVLAVFLYQFTGLALAGRTVGKALFDLRVCRAGGPVTLPVGRAAVRAALGTTTDVGVFALACCVLVAGRPGPAAAVWLASVLVFWANLAPAVVCRRTVVDLLAGTVVRGGGLHSGTAHAVTAAVRGLLGPPPDDDDPPARRRYPADDLL